MKNIIIQLNQYKDQLEAVDQELQTLPEGYLLKRGKFYWHKIDKKELGITNDTELIRTLCRKRYLQARHKQLAKSIAAVSKSLDRVAKPTFDETVNSFSSAYQGLPETYFQRHSSVDVWLSDHYQKNPYPPDEWPYASKNGTPLRSKSEVLIANHLEDYGIPYRYDAALTLGGQTKYPDFTIKNPFTGKLIIWEHFGALHQPKYEEIMAEKMGLYLKHGYVPFETLIYTFEFDVRGDRRLKDLIEQVILDDNQ